MNLLTPEQAFTLMMAGKNIECRNPSLVPAINEFAPVTEFSGNVYALPGFEFRLAANMTRIEGHLYTEAETTELAEGTEFFFPSLSRADFYANSIWRGDDSQKSLLQRKMVHLNEQSAINHAKALILASGGSFPQRVSISTNNVLGTVQKLFEDDAAKTAAGAIGETAESETVNGLPQSET